MSGDDRTRTGALSPDKRALSSSELRPQGLLRVARVGFEPTSRAHEAREDNRSSTALQAGSRATPKSGRQESNLRSPAPEAGGVANSPTTRRQIELRRQGSNLPFAINSRASYPLDHAGTKTEGEGVEPPRPRGPPVFETGYRTGWQSFRTSERPRQASNLQPPG
jgi:hypothetical protein